MLPLSFVAVVTFRCFGWATAVAVALCAACAGGGGARASAPAHDEPPSATDERGEKVTAPLTPRQSASSDRDAATVPDAVKGAADEDGGAPNREPEAAAPAPLPSGTTVLHIGDSFAGALGYELNRELKEAGITGILKYEKSTYIPTWAWKKEFPSYLWKYKPDLIMVTLGGNELGIANPEKRAETVQRLVKRFDGIPCVWIGIPLWEGANPTLMRVIEENSAPCRFIDSHALIPDMQRAKDNIHPSLSARKLWAETVVRWLAEHRRSDGESPWVWKDERD